MEKTWREKLDEAYEALLQAHMRIADDPSVDEWERLEVACVMAALGRLIYGKQ